MTVRYTNIAVMGEIKMGRVFILPSHTCYLPGSSPFVHFVASSTLPDLSWLFHAIPVLTLLKQHLEQERQD